jgi:hypothetical protein
MSGKRVNQELDHRTNPRVLISLLFNTRVCVSRTPRAGILDDSIKTEDGRTSIHRGIYSSLLRYR